MKKISNSSSSFRTDNRGNTGLIVLITVLVCLVVFLTVVLGIFAKKTASIDKQVTKLEKTVKEISTLSGTLNSASANDTTSFSADEAQAEQSSSKDNKSNSAEDGTLSSPKGETKVVTGNLSDLQTQLQTQVDTLNASDGNWAIYAENLNTNASCTVGDSQMQAASLIKLFIMGTVYENYDAVCEAGGGRETVNSALTSMITVSDNDAANNLVTWLGGGDSSVGMAAVNSFCEEHGYTNTHMGRMLLADNTGDDNYTSVTDCGKLLREIYNNSESLTYPKFLPESLTSTAHRSPTKPESWTLWKTMLPLYTAHRAMILFCASWLRISPTPPRPRPISKRCPTQSMAISTSKTRELFITKWARPFQLPIPQSLRGVSHFAHHLAVKSLIAAVHPGRGRTFYLLGKSVGFPSK